jgi:NitT/TauT family transport system substrate-binding protein
MSRLPYSASRLLGVLTLAATLALGSGAGPAAQSETDTAEPTPLKVGLGFFESVQFAQFYFAEQAGYYADAGLDVTFENRIDPELITLLARGAVDIGMADGTSLIPAVSQGIPVVYGATIYGRNPNVLFSLAESGIEDASDLVGAKVGIPGRYGSSWVALQSLLAAEGVSLDDVEVVTYPDFGQAVAVATGQVDAATGFATNEPVQLTLQGLDLNVIQVSDVAPLPGPGLVAGIGTLEAKGEALTAFTEATVRAMEEITDDPRLGLEATFERVPELSGDPETQLAILEATIASWMGDHAMEHGLGSVDRASWESGLEIMRSLPDSTVSDELAVDDLITDALGS